jgi:hypothetical protein
MVDLLSLISAYGIVEKEREVRDEIQVVAQPVRLNLAERVASPMLPVATDVVAIGLPAIGLVYRSEPIDETWVDGALRRQRLNRIETAPGYVWLTLSSDAIAP